MSAVETKQASSGPIELKPYTETDANGNELTYLLSDDEPEPVQQQSSRAATARTRTRSASSPAARP